MRQLCDLQANVLECLEAGFHLHQLSEVNLGTSDTKSTQLLRNVQANCVRGSFGLFQCAAVAHVAGMGPNDSSMTPAFVFHNDPAIILG